MIPRIYYSEARLPRRPSVPTRIGAVAQPANSDVTNDAALQTTIGEISTSLYRETLAAQRELAQTLPIGPGSAATRSRFRAHTRMHIADALYREFAHGDTSYAAAVRLIGTPALAMPSRMLQGQVARAVDNVATPFVDAVMRENVFADIFGPAPILNRFDETNHLQFVPPALLHHAMRLLRVRLLQCEAAVVADAPRQATPMGRLFHAMRRLAQNETANAAITVADYLAIHPNQFAHAQTPREAARIIFYGSAEERSERLQLTRKMLTCNLPQSVLNRLRATFAEIVAADADEITPAELQEALAAVRTAIERPTSDEQFAQAHLASAKLLQELSTYHTVYDPDGGVFFDTHGEEPEVALPTRIRDELGDVVQRNFGFYDSDRTLDAIRNHLTAAFEHAILPQTRLDAARGLEYSNISYEQLSELWRLCRPSERDVGLAVAILEEGEKRLDPQRTLQAACSRLIIRQRRHDRSQTILEHVRPETTLWAYTQLAEADERNATAHLRAGIAFDRASSGAHSQTRALTEMQLVLRDRLIAHQADEADELREEITAGHGRSSRSELRSSGLPTEIIARAHLALGRRSRGNRAEHLRRAEHLSENAWEYPDARQRDELRTVHRNVQTEIARLAMLAVRGNIPHVADVAEFRKRHTA